MANDGVDEERGVEHTSEEDVNEGGSQQAPTGGQQAPSGGQQGPTDGHQPAEQQPAEHQPDGPQPSGQQPTQHYESGQQVPDGGRPAAGGPAPRGATHGAAPASSGTGLDENVAGALSYLLGVLTGVLFFVVDKDRPFVRFHAAQSMVVFGGLFVAAIVLSVVGGIVSAIAFSGGVGGAIVGGLLSLVLLLVWPVFGFGSLVAWLYLMY